ncbi:MAG: hypothetical protein ACYTBZ_14275 [Planctomycetota bacterium]|jgi:hypothetical protein
MAQLTQDGPHFSLVDLEGYLDSFSVPRGNFDPAGSWGHKYTVWISVERSQSKSRANGYVKLKRRPAPQKGMFQLQVEQSTDFANWQSQLTKANIKCKADRLATPVSWNVESAGFHRKDKKATYPKFAESAVAAEGQIVRTAKRTRRMTVSKTFTHDWALFEAAQRLKGEQISPIEFDMLEDFDLLRPKQRLSYHGTTEIKIGGKITRLTGYHQIGEGILPIHYWLDQQHRLLIVTGGCRVYIFDSEIKKP